MTRRSSKIYAGALFTLDDVETKKFLIEVLAMDMSSNCYYCFDHITGTYLTAYIEDFNDERLREPTKAELVLYKKNYSIEHHISEFKPFSFRPKETIDRCEDMLKTIPGNFITDRG